MAVLISPGPPPVVWQGRGSICEPLGVRCLARDAWHEETCMSNPISSRCGVAQCPATTEEDSRRSTSPRPRVRDRESEATAEHDAEQKNHESETEGPRPWVRKQKPMP